MDVTDRAISEGIFEIVTLISSDDMYLVNTRGKCCVDYMGY
jgi:hypothetical protein